MHTKATLCTGIIALTLLAPATLAHSILYVDDNAPPDGNGRTWETAYKYLQDALRTARNSGGTVTEIRVGVGTYRPDQGGGYTAGDRDASFILLNGVAIRGGYAGLASKEPDQRIPCFPSVLTGDLGGNDWLPAPGVMECVSEPNQPAEPGCTMWDRDWDGDVDANDLGMTENSKCVVKSAANSASTELDGFAVVQGYNTTGSAAIQHSNGDDSIISMCIIQANFSDGAVNCDRSQPTWKDTIFGYNAGRGFGGGAKVWYSSPHLQHCLFQGNVANFGAGLYIGDGSANTSLSDCDFVMNHARSYGGGVLADYHTGAISNCRFISNYSGWGGGAIQLRSSSSLIVDCSFKENSASYRGGGLATMNSSNPRLTRCVFSHNSAVECGGGIDGWSDFSITDSLLVANQAPKGGAIYTQAGAASMNGCTLYGNKALASDGTSGKGGGVCIGGNQLTLKNCILWANTGAAGPQITVASGSKATVSFCNVEGGANAIEKTNATLNWLTGNFSLDPLLRDTDGADDNPLTWDDNDYHLSAGSPCINAGDDSAAQPGDKDIDGQKRVQDCRIDIGADEYSDYPDCNNDGESDRCEILMGLAQDCDLNGVPDSCDADTDGDGAIDGCDGCPSDSGKTQPGACGCGVPDTDTDHDGTLDCMDGCPTDPAKIAPGACGCGTPDTDSDGDHTPNCLDGCPSDPSKTQPGVCGCGTADVDTDHDGTLDCRDGCPADPAKTAPGACGCGIADVDSDHDGKLDCQDGCPNDPGKIAPGQCGCGAIDTDTDHDGTADCKDSCPNDPAKTSPGQCGCGVADTDSDHDGVSDCNDRCNGSPDKDSDNDGKLDCEDGCPHDAAKTVPGQCGCGIPDIDTDADGTANCVDTCPRDATKTAPGQCGCGVPDTDTDGDGTADCLDGCPNDAGKLAPGLCGCGSSDADNDKDGVINCLDSCENDPAKTSPGQCGCGQPETDSDGDRKADCIDQCPKDAKKTAPGRCGCGVADVDSDVDGVLDCVDACPNDAHKSATAGLCGCGILETDTDKDGTPDCIDQCPKDSTKSEPGTCGCGVSDADSDLDGVADCNDACPSDRKKTAAGACGCGVVDTDTDGDGRPDCIDNCPAVSNADQLDNDRDGTGDACEPALPPNNDSNGTDEPSGRPDPSDDAGQDTPNVDAPTAPVCGAGLAEAMVLSLLGAVTLGRISRRLGI